MPPPKDPIKRAAYIEKARENNLRQFSDPANRDKQRQKAIEQFSDPAKREAAAEKGRALWADPDYRARMVEAALNKPAPSAETNKKIGDAHRGMKRPPEQGRKISAKAIERWATYSDEEKQRITSIGLKQADFFWANLSEEEKLAIAVKSRTRWEDKPQEEKDAFVAAIMKAANMRPNKVEIKLQEILDSICPDCYKYVGDGSLIIGGKNPDFAYGTKLIEMFGAYWHQGEDPQVKIAHFRKHGYETLVIWDYEMLDENLRERIIDFHSS